MNRNRKRRGKRSGSERPGRRRRLGPRDRRGRAARIRLAMLGALALIVVVVVIVARLPPPQVDLPAGVLGTWVASDQRYEGRFITFSRELFTIGIDDGGSTHRIKGVWLEQVAGRDFYKVTYIVGEDEHMFSFRFDARSRTLIPRNQPNLRWMRRGA